MEAISDGIVSGSCKSLWVAALTTSRSSLFAETFLSIPSRFAKCCNRRRIPLFPLLRNECFQRISLKQHCGHHLLTHFEQLAVFINYHARHVSHRRPPNKLR